MWVHASAWPGVQIVQLKQELRDASVHASQWATENYFHPCQIAATRCTRGSSLFSAAQLLFPRVTIPWGGLCGRFLSEMPWKYRFLWIFKPRLAILHAELEAYGFSWSLETLFWHTANLMAAYMGPLLEDFLLGFLLASIGFKGVARLSPLLSVGSLALLRCSWPRAARP
jgi:hypothetical protein